MAFDRVPHEVDEAVIEENARTQEIATFAKTMNALLVRQGIHQEDMARDLGISTGSISYYRNGAKEPRLSTIVKIADYLGVDCHYLLTGVEAGDATTARELGLSGKAIEALKHYRADEMETTNKILETQGFKELLFIMDTLLSMRSDENADWLNRSPEGGLRLERDCCVLSGLQYYNYLFYHATGALQAIICDIAGPLFVGEALNLGVD